MKRTQVSQSLPQMQSMSWSMCHVGVLLLNFFPLEQTNNKIDQFSIMASILGKGENCVHFICSQNVHLNTDCLEFWCWCAHAHTHSYKSNTNLALHSILSNKQKSCASMFANRLKISTQNKTKCSSLKIQTDFARYEDIHRQMAPPTLI